MLFNMHLFCLCVQFVSKSLDQTEDEEWICAIGDAMVQQVALYNNMHEEKVRQNCVQ